MKYYLVIFLISISCKVSAQIILTLDSTKKILFEQNLGIKQSKLEQKIAQLDVDQANNNTLPSLYFNTNNQHNLGLFFDQVSGQLITGNKWSTSANANVGINLTLFQGFQKVNTIKSNLIALETKRLGTKKMKQELEIQAISLFFQTLINNDLYQASLVQLKLSERQLKQTEIQIAVGNQTLVDLAQAKNKIANDKLNIITSKNAYQSNLFKLKDLLEISQDQEVEFIANDLTGALQIEMPYHYAPESDLYLSLINQQIELAKLI